MSLESLPWQEIEQQHRVRVEGLLGGHLTRRSRGEKHPIFDFLFEYYSFRPAALAYWSPGFGVHLGGAAADKFLNRKYFERAKEGVTLAPFPAERRKTLDWTATLLAKTAQRAPAFGCHGLHEWAMVFRDASSRRHQSVALRLASHEIEQVVESLPVNCTHFDAYRFFTPAAKELNRWDLKRETQPEFDQPGCIHANMDLYKHAYKLSPYVPASLVVDAFELAFFAREIDMRASPYDLRDFGYEPIRIETPEGRADYAQSQLEISRRGTPIRESLLKWVLKIEAGGA